MKTSEQIPEYQSRSYDQKNAWKRGTWSLFLHKRNRRQWSNTIVCSDSAGKQGSDCWKLIVGRNQHSHVPPFPCLAVEALWPCCRSPLFLYSKVTARSCLYAWHSSCGQFSLDRVTESRSGPSWLMLNIIVCMIIHKLQDVSWPSLGGQTGMISS